MFFLIEVSKKHLRSKKTKIFFWIYISIHTATEWPGSTFFALCTNKNRRKNNVEKSLRKFGMLCFLGTNKLRNIRTKIFCFVKISVNLGKIFVIFWKWSGPLAEISAYILKLKLLWKIMKFVKMNAPLCFCSIITLKIISHNSFTVFNTGMCAKQSCNKKASRGAGTQTCLQAAAWCC